MSNEADSDQKFGEKVIPELWCNVFVVVELFCIVSGFSGSITVPPYSRQSSLIAALSQRKAVIIIANFMAAVFRCLDSHLVDLR